MIRFDNKDKYEIKDVFHTMSEHEFKAKYIKFILWEISRVLIWRLGLCKLCFRR